MSNDHTRLEFMGQLAGGFAHEIKNPLSTIRLHLELMEEDLEDDQSEQGQRHLRKSRLILKEVRRLEEIVQEFLKISRGHDLKLTAVDLAKSLEELVDLVRPEAESKGVSVHLRISNKIGTVLLDENYFHRAMLNIVQNAILACEPKGSGDVIIELGRNAYAVGIVITDTGVGIPEGVRERIFRPYFTTRAAGTGMGLPMARRIIEEHGGYLAFDSVEEHGTRFMIMLPVSTGDTLSQIVTQPRSSTASGRFGAVLKSDEDAEEVAIDVPAVINRVLADSREEGT